VSKVYALSTFWDFGCWRVKAIVRLPVDCFLLLLLLLLLHAASAAGALTVKLRDCSCHCQLE
jgi:hypothetical protein